MQNKVAVIGSDSFLAKYLIGELASDYQITGYSRSNKLGLTNHISFDHPDQALDLAPLLDFNYIFYCAGSGIQAGNGEDYLFELNTYLPLEIALFLNDNGFSGKYVTFGSYAEIGNNLFEKSFNEQELIASSLPVPNNYGVSKRLLSRFFDSANLAIKYFHLILPTIYGKGENPKRLIPYLVSSLSRQEKPRLTGGYQTRQYIHMLDTAALLRELVESDQVEPGIYNVPCYETRRVKDIVASIYEALGADESLSPEIFQRFDETMKYLNMDASKLMSALPNWRPKISILESLDEYLS